MLRATRSACAWAAPWLILTLTAYGVTSRPTGGTADLVGATNRTPSTATRVAFRASQHAVAFANASLRAWLLECGASDAHDPTPTQPGGESCITAASLLQPPSWLPSRHTHLLFFVRAGVRGVHALGSMAGVHGPWEELGVALPADEIPDGLELVPGALHASADGRERMLSLRLGVARSPSQPAPRSSGGGTCEHATLVGRSSGALNFTLVRARGDGGPRNPTLALCQPVHPLSPGRRASRTEYALVPARGAGGGGIAVARLRPSRSGGPAAAWETEVARELLLPGAAHGSIESAGDGTLVLVWSCPAGRGGACAPRERAAPSGARGAQVEATAARAVPGDVGGGSGPPRSQHADAWPAGAAGGLVFAARVLDPTTWPLWSLSDTQRVRGLDGAPLQAAPRGAAADARSGLAAAEGAGSRGGGGSTAWVGSRPAAAAPVDAVLSRVIGGFGGGYGGSGLEARFDLLLRTAGGLGLAQLSMAQVGGAEGDADPTGRERDGATDSAHADRAQPDARSSVQAAACLRAPTAAELASARAGEAGVSVIANGNLTALAELGAGAGLGEQLAIVGSSRCALLRRSRAHAPGCGANGTLSPLPLLVTSVGAGGTTFAARLLDHLVPTVHDKGTVVGDSAQAVVSWPHAFSRTRTCHYPVFSWRDVRRRRRRLRFVALDSGNSAAWRKRDAVHDARRMQGGHRFAHVVHLVRAPPRSISSRWSSATFDVHDAAKYPAVCQADVELPPWPQGLARQAAWAQWREWSLRVALRHWVTWHAFVDATAEARLRVEDVDTASVGRMLRRAGLGPQRWRAGGAEQVEKAAREMARMSLNHEHANHSVRADWPLLRAVDPYYYHMALKLSARYGYMGHLGEAEREDLRAAARFELQCGFARAADDHAPWGCHLSPEPLCSSPPVQAARARG